MMNGLALLLSVASIVAASIWSPHPDQKQNRCPGAAEEVIVKEGTRVVVVEYDKEGPAGNTKVSISTQDPHPHDHVFQKVPESEVKFKDKVKEAFEVLPNMGQDLSRGQQHPQNGQNPTTPKYQICDALGTCKEKIAAKIGRSGERVSEKVHEIEDGAKETYSKAKEKVIGNVEEKLSQKAHDIKEEVKDAYSYTKGKVSEKTHMVEEAMKDAVEKAKGASKPASDVGGTIFEDVAGNASKIEAASRDQMVQSVKGEGGGGEGEEKGGWSSVKNTMQGFQKQFQHDLFNMGYDVFNYILPASFRGPLMSVIHILGFATAYGVCVWVTFFSSFVLAGALPNQQFGIVQSKIYPFYFKTMASSVGLALLGHVLNQGQKVVSGRSDLFQGYALLATLLMVILNLLYFEPRAAKVMFERLRAENEKREGEKGSGAGVGGAEKEGASADEVPQVMGRLDQEMVNDQVLKLNERLKKLNTISSFLNILTLMALKVHLVYLAHRLYVTLDDSN